MPRDLMKHGSTNCDSRNVSLGPRRPRKQDHGLGRLCDPTSSKSPEKKYREFRKILLDRFFVILWSRGTSPRQRAQEWPRQPRGGAPRETWSLSSITESEAPQNPSSRVSGGPKTVR